MQNIRLIKRKDLEKQQERKVEPSVAAKAEPKTAVDIVKTWVNEHKTEQPASARKMFDALFAH
jgi:hypothetical protein